MEAVRFSRLELSLSQSPLGQVRGVEWTDEGRCMGQTGQVRSMQTDGTYPFHVLDSNKVQTGRCKVRKSISSNDLFVRSVSNSRESALWLHGQSLPPGL